MIVKQNFEDLSRRTYSQAQCLTWSAARAITLGALITGLIAVPLMGFAQSSTVTVDASSNNILIEEIDYNVVRTNTDCSYTQTASAQIVTTCADSTGNPVDDVSPTSYAVPVDIVRVQGEVGSESIDFLPAIRFLAVDDYNNSVGNNSVPAAAISAFTPTAETEHNVGTSGPGNPAPAFTTALESVISDPDIRSYWNLATGNLELNPTPAPAGPEADFFDVLFADPILPTDVVVISERNGNSAMTFIPLDSAGDVIANSQAVAIAGAAAPNRYQWQTLVGNPLDGNCCGSGSSNQRQWLIMVSGDQFYNANPTGSVFGYRVRMPDIADDGGDGKILLYREGLDYGDAPDDPSFSYDTFLGATALGARHRVTDDAPWLPDLGGPTPTTAADNDTDEEANGQPTASADGDADDEQGVQFPSFDNLAVGEVVSCDGYAVPNNLGDPNDSSDDEFFFCAAVRVANPTGDDAQLVGWLDFNGDGEFDDTCSTTDGQVTDTCERSDAQVRIGNAGLDDFTGTCSASGAVLGDLVGAAGFSAGNIPPNCEGVVVLQWQYDPSDTLTLEQTYARIRITTDASNGFLGGSADPLPNGRQENGEVEDYRLDAGSLPVSISSFDSAKTKNGLKVSWTTVSETENIGFHIWADNGRKLELLSKEMIPSTATDAVGVNHYSVTLSSRAAMSAESLLITAVDSRGGEEMYGQFDIGTGYGRIATPTAIPWQSLQTQMNDRLQSLGYADTDQGPRRNSSNSRTVAVDFAVSNEGMQSISFDALAAAGLDLRGVDPNSIAVTLKGTPVAREIVGSTNSKTSNSNQNRYGLRAAVDFSGSEIRFWGVSPGYPDALYVSEYVYRVSVDPAKALPATEGRQLHWRNTVHNHIDSITINEDNNYSFTSVLDDPWFAKRLRSNTSNDSYSATINLPKYASTRDRAQLEIVVAGVTDFEAAPDHHVEVSVNGQKVADVEFDGRVKRTILADLDPGVLRPGPNDITVRLPGGTEAPVDLVYVDTVKATFTSRLVASNNRLLIEPGQSADGFRVFGLSKALSAYAHDGNTLMSMPVSRDSRGSIVFPAALGKEASYWISGRDALHRPSEVGSVSADNTARQRPADFIVIAHPAFMPASSFESHPLNDFINARQADGWRTRLVDVSDIQLHYGGGMALPHAVTDYLRQAHASGTSHVLLVGGDSYDYHDRLDLGSISHIPTLYQATTFIPHTPSDALLADVDGDGVSDLALGRWPVRSMSDLQSVVTKTLDWDFTTSGLQNSVWITDTDDPAVASFEAQAERMADTLIDAGWSDSSIDRIHMNDIGYGIEAAGAARNALFDVLSEGRSITGFVGHGSPTAWTFQSMLFPSDVANLDNEGFPTLIGTLTCYTSYFVSPHNDTVAHRFMNGLLLDQDDQPIYGAANGSVAIHGAATLSQYSQNEYFARGVLNHQLNGETLGAAVLATRRDAAARNMDDLVTNWTLLGDPTLRMATD